MGDPRVMASATLLTAIGLTLATITTLKLGLHLLFYLFLPDCHMGVLAMVLLATGLAIRSLFSPERTWRWWAAAGSYALICLLGSMSDLLFISQFLLAFTATVAVVLYFDLFSSYQCLPSLGLGWGGCIRGWWLVKYFINRAGLDQQAPMTIDRMADALKGFLHGAQMQFSHLNWLHIAAAGWILFCVAYAARSVRRHVVLRPRHTEMPCEARRRVFLFLFLMFSGIGSVAALIASGAEGLLRDYDWSMHYQYPLYFGALFGCSYLFSLLVTRLTQSPSSRRAYLWGIGTLAVLVPAAAFLAAPKDRPGLNDFYPPLVRFLDENAAKYGLKYGVGGYWQTKWVNLFSRSRVSVHILRTVIWSRSFGKGIANGSRDLPRANTQIPFTIL